MYLSSINPLANIILFIHDMETFGARKILTSAWTSYKMLNLMIVDVMEGCCFLFNPFTDKVIRVALEEEFDFRKFSMERISDLNGYPLKINVFDCLMLCRVLKKKKYELACGEILDSFKRTMNATLEYVEPHDNEEFGYIHPNGTYMGALGEIEYNRVDIAVDLRIMAEFKDAVNLYFLKPAYSVKFCFVVPNNFYPLTFEVFPHKFVDTITLAWVVISMFVLILVTYIINRITNVPTGFVKIALSYFSLYNNVSITATPTKTYSRLLCGTMLIFTIIMSNSYQGSIIKQLNRMGNAANINTIHQLLTSGLVIRVPSGPDKYIRDFQSFPMGSLQRKLFDKKIITDTSSAIQIKYAAYNREAAILCPNHYIEFYKTIYLSNGTGESLINYVPQCVYAYYMSVMVPKSSPFIRQFNNIIQLIVEAGLIEFQYSNGMAESKLAYTRQVKEGVFFQRTDRLLSMKELFTLFKYYTIWLGVTIIVLILEILVSKCRRLCKRSSVIP